MKKYLFFLFVFTMGCPAPVKNETFKLFGDYVKIKIAENGQCPFPLFIEYKLVYRETLFSEGIFVYDGVNDFQSSSLNTEDILIFSPLDCSFIVFNYENKNYSSIELEVKVKSMATNSEGYFSNRIEFKNLLTYCEYSESHEWEKSEALFCMESLPENAVIELRQENLIDWENVYEESCTDYVSGQ